jgi:hypothetical protein
MMAFDRTKSPRFRPPMLKQYRSRDFRRCAANAIDGDGDFVKSPSAGNSSSGLTERTSMSEPRRR